MITNTLYNKWNDKPIYLDNIEQSFKPGTFHVRLLSSQPTGIISNRRYKLDNYDIAYWGTSVSDTMSMGADLIELFETFTHDDNTLHGHNMTYNIVDGVGHLNLSFYTYSDKTEVSDDMEIMTIEVEL